ncbi:hypothetical protein ACIRPR_33465 [Streptomyces griseoflavus]|uniref:hypothetical protein n=1 Tax=Streptomyces griseoflavus TaxID=35619 RepID=UPI0037F56FDA
MQNPSGTPKPNLPQPYGTPDASLVVFAGDPSGRHAAPLNTLTDGTPVVAAGMVLNIREHGTIDAPRATLQLVNDFGQATYAAADTDVLTEYSMCLLDGVEVSLHGIARRPFEGDAELDDPRTNYVQIVRVEPLFG